MASHPRTHKVLLRLRNGTEVYLGECRCPLEEASVKEEELHVFLEEDRDCIYLTPLKEGESPKSFGDGSAIWLGHSPICPVRAYRATEDFKENKKLPEMRVGVVVLMECTADGEHRTLLTRRAATRLFPNFWVVPGGHIDEGESTQQAALREVQEETGILLNPEDLSLHCLWESTYPISLADGNPHAHHLVVFYRARLPENITSRTCTLRLQEEEVSAAAWITKSKVEEMLSVRKEDSKQGVVSVEGVVLHDGQLSSPRAIDIEVGKVGLGHLYALLKWCDPQPSHAFYGKL